MKQVLVLCFAMFVTGSLSAEVRDLTYQAAEKLAQDYRRAHPDLLFQKTLAVLPPATVPNELREAQVGESLAALLKERLHHATLFTLVDRDNLPALLKEIEFGQSGLVDAKTAPQYGQLLGADLLLTGTLTEVAGNPQLSLQLIEAGSGKVEAAVTVSYPRSDLLASAEQFVRSSFQAPNGIFLGPSLGMVTTLKTYLISEKGNSGLVQAVPGNPTLQIPEFNFGYRFFPWLSGGMGVSAVRADQFFYGQAQVSFADGSSTFRYVTFTALGPNLFTEAWISPTPRLNLGLRLEGIVFASSAVDYDLTSVPVVVPDWTDPMNPTIKKSYQRVNINAWMQNTVNYALRVSASGEYLLSDRLALTAKAGYYYQPRFVPTSFQSPGSKRDSNDTDSNGIFPEYQNFDFSRADGTAGSEKIGFDFSGFGFEVGLALQF